jgi:signal transduction histidine kinase
MIDSSRMRQAISNLLGNAIKYSLPQSEVHIRIKKSDMWVSVEVEDQGIGISESELDKIWVRGYRCKGNNVDGFGIGLSVAKAIVEAHGGKILASSKPGIGSKFTVLLPN